MKKFVVGILSAAFVLGAGTAVFAAANGSSNADASFEKMLPFMQKMHPDSTKTELKDMYKACHEENGMMDGTDGKEMNSKNMMNSL
ncbi:hypothetical protein [Neobacillus cucumis]|uniref:FAD/FMN-containing dehydrogenase n=1 Tax=Neobacillus cucumis TaxID=1740721 RepID=A0A2N5HBI0_9BACI|nr:hypothetical protein [Neobacillus cucumis]PLS02881.1 hypothetical protein CVD27_16985 [Neobacillus cucumis]